MASNLTEFFNFVFSFREFSVVGMAAADEKLWRILLKKSGPNELRNVMVYVSFGSWIVERPEMKFSVACSIRRYSISWRISSLNKIRSSWRESETNK